MRWLLELVRLARRRPVPPAARPESETDRHTARIEARLRGDSHWCPVCHRGAGGAWCGTCGKPTRALELGAWNHPPFARKARE